MSQPSVVTMPGKGASETNGSFIIGKKFVISLVACLLYLGVEFLPGFRGIDDMGSQWFYLVVLDFVVAGYIFFRRKDFEYAAAAIFKKAFSVVYLCLFVVAGIFVYLSINRVEALVCYARFVATIIAFFNIAIILHGRIRLFRLLAHLLAIVLLIQCLQSLHTFFSEMNHYRLTELVLSLKGRAGNKNIYAASLMAKIPFVLYCIYFCKIPGKVFNTIIFFLAALTILIINSRTTYLALILELVIFILFCLLQYIKGVNREQNIVRILLVTMSAIVAFFVSLVAISAARASFVDESLDTNQYGTVTDRLATIASDDDDSKQQRLFLWKHAVSYIREHPVKGCGYGNWKIASIPYTKELTNDLMVPVHAHNDFLEYFAELGFTGGVLFIGLFVCLLVYTTRVLLSGMDEATKIISALSIVALAGYAIDAFFNFPSERPVNQVFFVFIAAWNLMAYCKRQEESDGIGTAKKKVISFYPATRLLLAFLLLAPSAYITYLTYQSLVVQNSVIPDLNNEPLKLPLNKVLHAFPDIPNLTSSAQPIEAIVGRYLYEAKRYDEAIVYLEKGAKANPYIKYSEFLKADVYYAQNRDDSAFKYATIAFNAKPRAKTYYQTLVAICARRKDTVEIKKAFKTYTGFRPKEAFGYNFYLMGMLNAKQTGNLQLLALADSMIKKFPDDAELKVRRKEIISNMPQIAAAAAPVAPKTDPKLVVKLSQDLFASGAELFKKGDFKKAVEQFELASQLSNATYGLYENIAICYFNMHEWDKALPYFDRVIAMKTAIDGKSEYFKGAALINMGKPDQACPLLKVAKQKGYPNSDTLLATYCPVK